MISRLCLAVLLLAPVALAQQPPGPGSPPEAGPRVVIRRGDHFGGPRLMGPPGRWWKNADVVQKLGLSDPQVQRIEQVFQNSRLKLVDLKANLEREEVRLEPMIESDNPDEATVLAQIDKVAAQRAELEKANAQMAFAIRRVLTPEQWKKLQTLQPPRGQRMFFNAPAAGPTPPPPPPGMME